MPDLSFEITGVDADSRGVTPLLSFRIDITNDPREQYVQSVILDVQVRIEAVRRVYSDQEKERLRELFGDPSDWGRALRDRLWSPAGVVVPSFRERTQVDLKVPCTFDLNVASTKYFYGLIEGHVPLIFLFSGTVFYEQDGRILIHRIPWEKECRFRLALARWKELMNMHYPNCGWLQIGRDIFDQLYAYRRREGIPTWDEAISRLLESAETQVAA